MRALLLRSRRSFRRTLAAGISLWALAGIVLAMRSEYLIAFEAATLLAFACALATMFIYEPWARVTGRMRSIPSYARAVELDMDALWEVVGKLSEQARLACRPRLFLSFLPEISAYTAGLPLGKMPILQVTAALLKEDRSVWEAVVAHELGHIRNWDILKHFITVVWTLCFLYLAVFLLITVAVYLLAYGMLGWQAVLIPLSAALGAYLSLKNAEYALEQDMCADVRAACLLGSVEPLTGVFRRMLTTEGLADPDYAPFLELRILNLYHISKD